jgi:transcription elongation factor Elf1
MDYGDHFRNGSNLGGAAPDDAAEMHTCPQCDHEQDEAECFLGQLGTLTHYRCRYCGMDWNES